MGQIVSAAAKPKRCNLNKLSQLGIPSAGEYILVSSDNSMNAAGQGNFDCYIVGNGRDAATALELKYLDDSTHPYIVEEVNKAVADIQPIEITGDVTNAPDEEDLTSENQGGTDVLKFKDKAYNAALYSGLGRVYLRKNIVTLEETGKNVLTQAMVNTANTIYHIQYDYDLNGETITMPAGCVLEFDGGSISNGTLVGNNTAINAQLVKIFDVSVVLSGSWDVEYSFPEWWGDIVNNISFANAIADTVLQGAKRYVVDHQIKLVHNLLGKTSRMITNSTGTSNFKDASCVLWVGDNDEQDIAMTETGNSVFLIHNQRNIVISNVAILSVDSADVDVSKLYTNIGFRTLNNPSFSAIRFTTLYQGTGYNDNLIEECRIVNFPIGINFHDLSLTHDNTHDVATDKNKIRRCNITRCDYGILLNSANAYSITIESCGISAYYQCVRVLWGHVNIDNLQVGPFSSAGDEDIIKTIFYLGEHAGNVNISNVYSENHYGLALYDERTRENLATMLYNCVFLHNSSYKIDDKNYTLYLSTAQRSVIIACTFSFGMYTTGITTVIASYVPTTNGNTDKVTYVGVPQSRGHQNTRDVGFGQLDKIRFITSDGSEAYIARNTAGEFQFFLEGYGSATISFAKKFSVFPGGLALNGVSSLFDLLTIANNSGGRCILSRYTVSSNLVVPVITAGGVVRTLDGYRVEAFNKDPRQGDTANRPSHAYKLVGQMYFDTDLGKPIWWNGTAWVDATGVPAESSLKVLPISQTDYDDLATKDTQTLYVITP